MSARPARQPVPVATVPRPLQLDDLARVLDIEARCYSHPWTRGNFIDSLAAGYLSEVLWAPGAAADDTLVGYFVAMVGVDELHLLNLTVAPRWQQQGHACALLDLLEQRCREHAAATLLLEVRQGNERARQVYRRRGFAEIAFPRVVFGEVGDVGQAVHRHLQLAAVGQVQVVAQHVDALGAVDRELGVFELAGGGAARKIKVAARPIDAGSHGELIV